jgi:transposase InsO family protein
MPTSEAGSVNRLLSAEAGLDTAMALMRRIDELHLQYPFAGARMLRDLLRHEGYAVGRRQVATLMRRMGITAIYRMPRTSQRHPAHRIYPLSAAPADDHPAESCVGV